jgi:hypothetical protein
VLFNKEILVTIIILFLANIVIWFQLNAQIKWDWFKDHYWLMALLGVPISYALLYSTKYGYMGFGELWPIRLLGFAVGMMTFPFITYMILGEGITLKTGISIVLAGVIMILQLI